MPLPMQGKKLIPGHHHVGRRRVRSCAPDRRHGDRTFDAPDQLGDPTAAELAAHGCAVSRAVMGCDVGAIAAVFPMTVNWCRSTCRLPTSEVGRTCNSSRSRDENRMEIPESITDSLTLAGNLRQNRV